MAPSHERWLLEQLPAWEREGIVTPAAAATLRGRYRAEHQPAVARMVIAATGSLLIGAGLIAIVASNWDDLSRGMRLAMALVPLALSQAVTLLLLPRRETPRHWMIEAAAFAQALAAGAALALVSQIYNLPGEWPDLLFWWCLVCLPLLWATRSQAVAIFVLAAIAGWTLAQAFDGVLASRRPPYEAIALLAGILPHWPGADLRARPAAGGRLVLAGSVLTVLLAIAAAAGGGDRIRPNGADGFLWMAAVSAAIVMLFPLSAEGVREPLSRKPQVVLGGLALFCLALAATYREPARALVQSVGPAVATPWCWPLLAVLVAFAAWAVRQRRHALLAVAALAALPVPLRVAVNDESGWTPAIAYSLVLLATAVALILIEFVGRQGAARLGAGLITILVLLRMADADLSLLAKGVAFIVIGAFFLAFNAFVSRRRAASSGASS
jgi:hypothetical protein